MASDGESSEDVSRPLALFRPKARAAPISSTAVAAKRARRVVMIADGYSDWQMTRAEAQRIADGVSDAEPVVQSVYRFAIVVNLHLYYHR